MRFEITMRHIEPYWFPFVLWGLWIINWTVIVIQKEDNYWGMAISFGSYLLVYLLAFVKITKLKKYRKQEQGVSK
jgi:hypothetical protein